MNILAVETSWTFGGLALLRDDEVLRTKPFSDENAHGKLLGRSVLRILKKQDWTTGDLDLLCVDQGPGSYTGLRVGITFVKTLSFAEDLPIATASAPDAIARTATADMNRLCVVIDAQWNELYTAMFTSSGDRWTRETEITLQSPNDIIETIGSDTRILGNGIHVFRETFEQSDAQLGPKEDWYPDAEWIGKLGREGYESGDTVDPVSLQPLYLRPTQADVPDERKGNV